ARCPDGQRAGGEDLHASELGVRGRGAPGPATPGRTSGGRTRPAPPAAVGDAPGAPDAGRSAGDGAGAARHGGTRDVACQAPHRGRGPETGGGCDAVVTARPHVLRRGARVSDSLPIAPSLSPTLERTNVPDAPPPVDRRVMLISGIAAALGLVAALVAELLTHLIAFVTNLAFYGRWSVEDVGPAGHDLGLLVVVPPLVGGLIVGLMARFGSTAIRGHGIPEAMERVLTNRSRIPPRITILKPLSAAIAIGTGGPFGAEGPIIATGGALGSLAGQAIRVTGVERKILLAAGAAAGTAATFGTPVAAVLLAIELLLFEFRARSIIPVAIATVVATAARIALHGADPVFLMPVVQQPGGGAIAFYTLLGAFMGLMGVVVTRTVLAVEDAF